MRMSGRTEPRARYVVLPEEVLDLHDWDEYLSLLDETGPFTCLRRSTSFVLPEEVPDLQVWDEYLCFADGVVLETPRAPKSAKRPNVGADPSRGQRGVGKPASAELDSPIL